MGLSGLRYDELERGIRVFFSTVVRAAPLEKGGALVRLEWQTKTVEAQVPLYPTDPEIDDPNPRGNARGGRGIAFFEDNVVAATYHTLQVFDQDLRLRQNITHPLMVGLHEIGAIGEAKVAVAATAIDAALVVDLTTGEVVRQYWPREMPNLQRALNLAPLTIDKQIDNRQRFLDKKHAQSPSHLHLNAVAVWQGELYALFNAFGVIANLDKDEVFLRDDALRKGHNLLFTEDGLLVVNDTFGRAVRVYDTGSRQLQKVIALTDFSLVSGFVRKHQLGYLVKGLLKKIRLHQLSVPRPVFVRGLDVLGDLLFVGLSPATILCIDRRSGDLVDAYRYSDDVAVCVHGLKVWSKGHTPVSKSRCSIRNKERLHGQLVKD